jgi:flagellar hook-associated protein 3 FlgL
MNRIASSTEHSNFIFYNRINEASRNRTQEQMANQHRINRLSDDPNAAAQSMRFQSKAARLDQYESNLNNSINSFAIVEGNITEATEIIQRIRELTVQGANGTYSQEDSSYMGREVDQLLNELVEISNRKDGNGLALFAGTRTDGNAFRVLKGNVTGVDGQVITGVEYTGNSGSRLMEYSDGATIETQFAGNKLFWAENQQLWGANNVENFVVREASTIIVDGQSINLEVGDSVFSVMQKINDADVAVKASLDPVLNTMVLSTTQPHQLWLDDGTGTVLSDLGIVNGTQRAPNNLANGSRSYGGSIFDVVMQTRDALYAGDQERLGGVILGGLDKSLDNINNHHTELGARGQRMEMALGRIGYESNSYKAWDDSLRGLNFAEVATEMANINTVLQATYSMASNIFKTTLMDFMR